MLQAGVCLSTLGPGATNFSTAIAYASLGGFPALFLTGQKPIRASKQGQFQIVKIVEHFEQVRCGVGEYENLLAMHCKFFARILAKKI